VDPAHGGAQSYLTPPGTFTQRLNGLTLDTDGNILVAVQQGAQRGAVYKVRTSDGQVLPFSNDAAYANPTFALVVPEPGAAAAAGVLLVAAYVGGRRRRRA
jgi:MYXO-CTERM domain-containing protein